MMALKSGMVFLLHPHQGSDALPACIVKTVDLFRGDFHNGRGDSRIRVSIGFPDPI